MIIHLKDKNPLNKKMLSTALLPLEILFEILLKLSIVDILTLSQTSIKFNKLSKDDILWKHLLKRDFNSDEKEEETWKEEYEYQVWRNPSELITSSTKRGESTMVKYLLYYSKNYNCRSILKVAAAAGQKEFLKEMVPFAYSLDRTIDFDSVVGAAAEAGEIDIVKLILNWMQRSKMPLGYNIILASATAGGHQEMIQLILDLIEINEVKVDYGFFLCKAASEGHQKIVEYFLPQYLEHTSLGRILCNSIRGRNRNLIDSLLKQVNPSDIDYSYFITNAIKEE